MNDIAKEMNEVIKNKSEIYYPMLSNFGKEIFMPKGIIVQAAQAKDLAKKYNATIGIATESGAPMVLGSLKKYFNEIKAGEIFNYAPQLGNQDLRVKWREKIIKQNPSLGSVDAISTPVVTSGLTHGIMLVADMFVNPGDEVIVPDKYWENYSLMIETRYNGVIKNFSLFDKDLKGFNVQSFDDTIGQAKGEKVIILLNFPNNPTGYTPTNREADQIVAVIKKHAEKGKKILVVCDDAYYGLLFEDDLLKGSIFGKVAGVHKNIAAIKIDGVSKEDYAWGFRVGFITFYDPGKDANLYKTLESKVGACIRSSISNCPQPTQSVINAAFGNAEYEAEKIKKYEVLKKRAVKTHEVVYAPQYKEFWDVYPFNSGYFMCLKLKGVDAEKTRMHLLNQYGVGTIVLGEDMRVAFSSVEIDQIEDLFKTIAQAVKDLRK